MRVNLKHIIAGLLLITLEGCNQQTAKVEHGEENLTPMVHDGYISVISTGMEFQVVTEISSGWNTFRYQNNSTETHFFILEKLPDGIRLENYRNELVPPFEEAFANFNQGDIEAGMKALEQVPTWFSEVEVAGGVGLISPGKTGETTIKLSPGIYAMECYVRMPDGRAHAFLGMLEEIIVTDSTTTLDEPGNDLSIQVSSQQGILFRDSISAGEYILGVEFVDQKQYETLLGHDVNLVKLDNGIPIDTLANWVNAADIKAFRTPAPSGLTFLGGVQDLPAGGVGYFKALLNPGRYVLISEVPDAIKRNMVWEFMVTDSTFVQ